MVSLGRSTKGNPEYSVWTGMIHRCHNPKRHNYPRYGGRGIVVCDRWRESFAAFLEDMGPRPSMRHQIDRIDNDGPYSPDNCRWASLEEQGRNKRSNHLITAFGKTQTLSEWATETGLRRECIASRLEYGWTPEEALTPEVRTRGPRVLTAFGKTQTIAAWCREKGIPRNTLFNRLERGWDAERALTEPIGRWPRNARVVTGRCP
jgi:hypothetical protein